MLKYSKRNLFFRGIWTKAGKNVSYFEWNNEREVGENVIFKKELFHVIRNLVGYLIKHN